MKKIYQILSYALSFLLGVLITYYSFSSSISEILLKDKIVTMDVSAVALLTLKKGEIDNLEELLNISVKADKEYLKGIEIKNLSEKNQKNLKILNSIYKEIEAIERNKL